ncbi:glycosyltransferase family 4 protein [Marinoscillum sp.]|uniref:glycosyltransferase family 4 protein n=1 Tax=Marinoscillum sp. TaxID=2024838 RepID=UPI003BA97A4C
MKIAQVCPYDFSRPGGVKNHIESLSRHLRMGGHEVKIITPFPDTNQPGVYHFGSNRSLNIGGTKIDVNIALGKERKQLKQFLKTENFDIIHFHTFWNPALPLQIRRFSNAKHVATFHDTPKNQFIGKNIMPIAAKGVFALMDAIISVSETQAAYINRFSKREISIIPNGIDLEEYQKPVDPIEKYLDGKFNLLFLGRLEERKGLIYALKSFHAIKQQNDEVRLIIAGDGDERQMAEDYINQYQLKDVEMLGFVPEEEKLRLLRTCDLYVAPALFGESFGIVLLEAMAMGTPIAGFANQGYLNVLSEEQKVYFAPPKDLDGLTQNIIKLMESKEQRTSLSNKGHEIVKTYDWNIHTKKIAKIYHQLLDQ